MRLSQKAMTVAAIAALVLMGTLVALKRDEFRLVYLNRQVETDGTGAGKIARQTITPKPSSAKRSAEKVQREHTQGVTPAEEEADAPDDSTPAETVRVSPNPTEVKTESFEAAPEVASHPVSSPRTEQTANSDQSTDKDAETKGLPNDAHSKPESKEVSATDGGKGTEKIHPQPILMPLAPGGHDDKKVDLTKKQEEIEKNREKLTEEVKNNENIKNNVKSEGKQPEKSDFRVDWHLGDSTSKGDEKKINDANETSPSVKSAAKETVKSPSGQPSQINALNDQAGTKKVSNSAQAVKGTTISRSSNGKKSTQKQNDQVLLDKDKIQWNKLNGAELEEDIVQKDDKLNNIIEQNLFVYSEIADQLPSLPTPNLNDDKGEETRYLKELSGAFKHLPDQPILVESTEKKSIKNKEKLEIKTNKALTEENSSGKPTVQISRKQPAKTTSKGSAKSTELKAANKSGAKKADGASRTAGGSSQAGDRRHGDRIAFSVENIQTAVLKPNLRDSFQFDIEGMKPPIETLGEIYDLNNLSSGERQNAHWAVPLSQFGPDQRAGLLNDIALVLKNLPERKVMVPLDLKQGTAPDSNVATTVESWPVTQVDLANSTIQAVTPIQLLDLDENKLYIIAYELFFKANDLAAQSWSKAPKITFITKNTVDNENKQFLYNIDTANNLDALVNDYNESSEFNPQDASGHFIDLILENDPVGSRPPFAPINNINVLGAGFSQPSPPHFFKAAIVKISGILDAVLSARSIKDVVRSSWKATDDNDAVGAQSRMLARQFMERSSFNLSPGIFWDSVDVEQERRARKTVSIPSLIEKPQSVSLAHKATIPLEPEILEQSDDFASVRELIGIFFEALNVYGGLDVRRTVHLPVDLEKNADQQSLVREDSRKVADFVPPTVDVSSESRFSGIFFEAIDEADGLKASEHIDLAAVQLKIDKNSTLETSNMETMALNPKFLSDVSSLTARIGAENIRNALVERKFSESWKELPSWMSEQLRKDRIVIAEVQISLTDEDVSATTSGEVDPLIDPVKSTEEEKGLFAEAESPDVQTSTVVQSEEEAELPKPASSDQSLSNDEGLMDENLNVALIDPNAIEEALDEISPGRQSINETESLTEKMEKAVYVVSPDAPPEKIQVETDKKINDLENTINLSKKSEGEIGVVVSADLPEAQNEAPREGYLKFSKVSADKKEAETASAGSPANKDDGKKVFQIGLNEEGTPEFSILSETGSTQPKKSRPMPLKPDLARPQTDSSGRSAAALEENDSEKHSNVCVIYSDPDGVEVYKGGTLAYPGSLIGRTPLELALAEIDPDLPLTLKQSGYRDYLLRPGQCRELSVALEPAGRVFAMRPPKLLESRDDGRYIGVWKKASPQPVDFNNDDKIDLLIGDGDGGVYLYQNVGDSSIPEFTTGQSLIDLRASGILASAFPTAVDWDNNGLFDLVVGTGSGDVLLQRNVGSSGSPSFSSTQPLRAGGHKITAGSNAYPTVVDWDKDGAKDLVVGRADGTIDLYLNVGDDANPSFAASAKVKAGNRILNVGKDAAPQVVDYNLDGLMDLAIGTGEGKIYLYVNSGIKTEPLFIEPLQLAAVDGAGGSIRPFFVDWNQDGSLDLMAGTEAGQIYLYQGSPE